jgi:hypothetical protein
MRTTPAPNPGAELRPLERRVRFNTHLASATLIVDDEVIAVSAPARATTPAAIATTRTAFSPTTTDTPNPTDFWTTNQDSDCEDDHEHIESVLQKIQDAVAKLREKRSSDLAEWQRTAVELAMTIATRLLHERVLAGEFSIETKIRDMIAQFGEDTAVTVSLNPADLTLLKSRLGGKPLCPGRPGPRFLPDGMLGRGECRVDGREAMLLSGFSRELQQIRDELLRSLATVRTL